MGHSVSDILDFLREVARQEGDGPTERATSLLLEEIRGRRTAIPLPRPRTMTDDEFWGVFQSGLGTARDTSPVANLPVPAVPLAPFGGGPVLVNPFDKISRLQWYRDFLNAAILTLQTTVTPPGLGD